MQLDVIGYRYTKEELEVLMSLQGREKIPALPMIARPDRDDFSKGIGALEENDILTNIGGNLLLDRIHAFIAESLSDCDRYFTVARENAFLALCVCTRVTLTAETKDGEHWVIRVAPDPENLREDFDRIIKTIGVPAAVRFRDGGEELESEAKSQEDLEKRAEKAIAELKKQEELFS